jgi:hypothetical protein
MAAADSFANRVAHSAAVLVCGQRDVIAVSREGSALDRQASQIGTYGSLGSPSAVCALPNQVALPMRIGLRYPTTGSKLGPGPRDSVRFGRAGFSGAAGAPGLNDGVTRREFRANLKENATAATAPLALVRLPLL